MHTLKKDKKKYMETYTDLWNKNYGCFLNFIFLIKFLIFLFFIFYFLFFIVFFLFFF